MNLISMIPDIPLDQISRDSVSNRPHEVPVLPKFSSPQLLLDLWKLLKYLARRNALQHPHHSRNRIPRRKTQEYMYMIRCHSHLLNLKTIILSNLPKYLFRLIPYVFPLNPFAILRSPHQMIFRIVYGMSSSSHTHEVSYTTFPLPPADASFIPVHRTGFSDAGLIKLS
jgi:hypothetical protein